MTTHKGFKRHVRARMAKTGESYAAARRSLLGELAPTAGDGGPPMDVAASTGQHPDSAALATLLRAHGVVAPGGRPVSEALVLVAGGGLGAGYILWEFKVRRHAVLTLGFRNQWQYPGIPGWMGKTTDRLGLEAVAHETGGAKVARETLDALLERGKPVIASVDQQQLGIWPLPDELSGYGGHPVVVIGRTGDGGYLVDDRGASPFQVPAETMARARARVGSYRHRLVELRVRAGPIAAARLRAALQAGLEDQVEHLGSPSDSFSLPAWRKWGRLMTDRRNAKGWPRVFADGRGLFGALISIVEGVDGRIGAYGGHLRDLYADGLDEAAAVLENPRLSDAAAAWRVAADLWVDLADAAVPAELDGAQEAIAMAEELQDAVMHGEAGRQDAATAAQRLWAIRERYADAFPLPAERVAVLFADLGERLGTIYEAERKALETTAGAAR
jgi:butirosin biosynthesis protein H-like/uncharacterized protein DUF4872